MPPPRTLLEAYVRQRRWSHRDFCRQYAETAEDLGLDLTVTPQHAGRWFGGKLKGMPYPAQCRVLEEMFKARVDRLFGPPSGDGDRNGSAERGVAAVQPSSPEEEIAMAADEASRFIQFAEQTNVGPHTLEQFEADIRRIVGVYPNRPVYPLFTEVRALRKRAFEKLEGQQFPDQSRQLYLIAGLLSGILANASFDLGKLEAAETQARTAFLCAELAGQNWLRAWIRGTQSLIAYWDDRPKAAVDLAVSARQYTPESGTALVRLASIEARARGRMHDRPGMEAALAFAADARARVTSGDDPGGMMAFPDAKQDFYAATARLWIGDAALAEEDAYRAVQLYEADVPEHRRLGEMNLARLDLATARLANGEIEGAADQIGTVIDVARQRPTDSVTRRLRQVRGALNGPRFGGSRVARDLADEIRVFTDGAAVPALSSGTDR